MTRLLLVATVLASVFVGAAAFTFGYAEGGSYMTNDPEACANCHVMGDYLTAWEQSSHRNVAVCNDCHAPHDVLGKYATKAINGWNHSVAFTTGDCSRATWTASCSRRSAAIPVTVTPRFWI